MTSIRSFRRTLALTASSGLAFSLACVVLADPPQTTPPDALKGPAVRDRQVPGVDGSFGEPGGDKKRFVNENRIPPQVFREAMETILAPDAPENLRVTDEQRTRYRGWMDDFRTSVAAYMKEHATELRELRQKAGEPGGRRPGQTGNAGGQPAQNPPQGDEAMKPDADPKETGAARERLQTIMQGAPKIEDLYTKIWTELNADQKKSIDDRIAEFRAQQAKEREDRYVQQRLGKKQAGKTPDAKPAPEAQPPQPPQPDGQAQTDGSIDPQRRERLIRLFSRLTPEQQEQLLQRLERAREDGGNTPPIPGRRARPGNDGPGEPKPAPKPDDSIMPPPPSPAGNQP